MQKGLEADQFGPPPELPRGPVPFCRAPGAPMVLPRDMPEELVVELPDMLEQAASRLTMPAVMMSLNMVYCFR